MHDSRKWHLTNDDAIQINATSLDVEIIWNAAVKSVKNNLPEELTAENGAKGFLSGEFFEEFEVYDDDGEAHIQKVPVSWTTIKDIYKKIVKYYGE